MRRNKVGEGVVGLVLRTWDVVGVVGSEAWGWWERRACEQEFDWQDYQSKLLYL